MKTVVYQMPRTSQDKCLLESTQNRVYKLCHSVGLARGYEGTDDRYVGANYPFSHCFEVFSLPHRYSHSLTADG